MNEHMYAISKTLLKQPGATQDEIDKAMAALGVEPPIDYVEFMRTSNGAEGFMRNGRYIMLDKVQQLVAYNKPYGLGNSGHDLVIFGSDGGTMLYAFDIRQSPATIVEVDAVAMNHGPVKHCGNTFMEFLAYVDSPLQ